MCHLIKCPLDALDALKKCHNTRVNKTTPKTMEHNKLVILSSAHLHPLEAKVINNFAYVSSPECSLLLTDAGSREFYKEGGLVCLDELMEKLKDIADYILFDPDANVDDDYKSYEW